MNILVVTEQFLFGGLETQIRDQIDYLVKYGHRVYLAVGRFANQSVSDLKLSGIISGLNIGIESKVEDLIKTVDLISGFIENNNINVIHAHPFLSLLPCIPGFCEDACANGNNATWPCITEVVNWLWEFT